MSAETPQNAPETQNAPVEKSTGNAEMRNRVRTAANNEEGLSRERLSSKPGIELKGGDEDISDKLAPDSRRKIWEMASRNMDRNVSEYKDNPNISEDQATYSRRIGEGGKAVIAVYVKGNSGAVIGQYFELGTFDLNKDIKYYEPYRVALNDQERDNINQCFA